MPNRIVREAILTSEAVCGLDWAEEVFYRRLMNIADDYGRHEANPQLLRSRCYPLQVDKVRVADIARWMAACQKAGLIAHYEVSGKQYLQIEKFGQQQRSPSKHPPPPDAALLSIDSKGNQPLENAHLGVVVFEGVGVADPQPPAAAADPPPRKRARPLKAPLPADFAVSESVRSWAEKHRFDLLDEHLQAFVRKCKAKGYEYADWDAAFMEAVREDWAKLRVRQPQKSAADPTMGYR